METVARDVRQAGYAGGCSYQNANVANTVDNSTEQNSFLNSTLPVEGYEGGVEAFPGEIASDIWSATTTPDAIVIRGLQDDLNITVTSSHPATSSNLIVTSNAEVTDGDILMLASADCSQLAIFAVSATPSTNKIQHNPGNSGSSTNCTKKLSGDFDCSNVNAGNYEYPAGSSVYKMAAKAFYIAPSTYDSTVPALFEKGIGSAGAVVSKELVSGVEDMQITYGVDTEASNPDGKANMYLPANSINSYQADAANAWVAWDRVVSARIELKIRARNIHGQVNDQNFNDKYLRKTIASTVRIRNAVLPANLVP